MLILSMEGFEMSQRFERYACSVKLCLYSFGFCLLFGCFVGCNNEAEKSPEPSDSETESASNVIESETTSVAASKTTNQISPAADSNSVLAPNAPPEEVCKRFMKLLQSGNRIAAENLFTRSALTTTTKAGLRLEPMGGPTSTVHIGDVRYATNLKKLAQVDCFISDKHKDGETVVEVTWQLHKQSTGYRISGVMLQLNAGKAKDLLSLENSYDVAKLQSLVGADVLDEPESRQAKADLSTTNLLE